MKDLIIGISAGRKHENYVKWISQDRPVKVIRLGSEEDNFDEISKCDGIILTGGEDVHPRFYDKPEYAKQFQLHDFNEARDEFELEILGQTQLMGIPVLGICRGLQIANVYFGGSLIPDIPSLGKPDHSKFEEGKDRYHRITLMNTSLLNEITGLAEGEVNSAHHQSVDRVGKGLEISAQSPDGIAEALERKADLRKRPFLMLVQWHPERMINQQSPFSKNIRERFLKECL